MTSQSTARDYRSKNHHGRLSATKFFGSYIVLLVWLALAGFFSYIYFASISQGIEGGLGGVKALMVIFSIITLGYFRWRTVRIRPDRFISATETPPPEVSTPTTSNMRLTFQRRQATYRSGRTRKNFDIYELLCWLTLSEAAYELIRTNNLMREIVFEAPTDPALIHKSHYIDPDADIIPSVTKYTLQDILADQPFLVDNQSNLELDQFEADIRQGLQNISAAIDHLKGSSISRSDSYEL